MAIQHTPHLVRPSVHRPALRPARPLEHNRPARITGAFQVVEPPLRVADEPGAAVFAAARRGGPVARDQIAKSTGFSIATVNRQVTALLEAGLLKERSDLTPSGKIGRPRVPVEVNHEPFVTVGVHVGAKTISIVATDLLGRTLDAVEAPTPRGDQSAALAALGTSVRAYLNRWRRRQVLWVGVTIGGLVDSTRGVVDHPRLGWTQAPVGSVLAATVGLPVSVAAHVDAMAGAELLLGRPSGQTSLYVYARETVGYALAINGQVHTPTAGPGVITHLPVRSELLGGDGTLEATVADEAVLAAAHRRGLAATTVVELADAARGGNATAAELLAERARVLGEALALLRDLFNPDGIVVGGQAFTQYPEGGTTLRAAFEARSVLGKRDIRITSFGNRVQEAGAGVVSLAPLYADPVGALRRANRRQVA